MSQETGKRIHGWLTDLFPICRSLSGPGVRETLAYLQNLLPDLKIRSVPSGTRAFDWIVPNEWVIRDAYVMDANSQRVIDFQTSNLHVVGYSEPVEREMTFRELDRHLHSLPDQPDAIPYITSYYLRRWGFCLTENQRSALRANPDARYEVKIDATLAPGELNYGELVIPGETEAEILLSTYVCHPSMANNELSGPGVAAALGQWLAQMPHRRFTYRILFLPETIGSIVYISQNLEEMKRNIRAGFMLTCVGDERVFSYLQSRHADTLSDRVAKHVLDHLVGDYITYTYLDRGSDERQYGSPGVELPICNVMRSKFGEYPEYHTSLDDLTLVTSKGLQGSFDVHCAMITALEENRTYRSRTVCEPQLSQRGLYPTLSTKDTKRQIEVMMNLIAYADGRTPLLDIAEIIGVYVGDLVPIAKTLLDKAVLEDVSGDRS